MNIRNIEIRQWRLLYLVSLLAIALWFYGVMPALIVFLATIDIEYNTN